MMPILIVMGVFLLVCAWFHEKKWEVFYLSIRNGRVLVVRGRVPTSLLHDFAEIVRDPVVRSGWIRVFRGEHGAELLCGGDIDEGPEQRMRNAMMLYPLSKLRHALPVARPTLGQMLGIAWLAWMFDRRDV
ncbi:MAG: hypothetical protein JWP01_1552 [Myxococcales bacterium]|nr:hypothetical protein [Myxococcales bacterium]